MTSPEKQIEDLATIEFPESPLTEAEVKTLRCAVRGETAICGPNIDNLDLANDPQTADFWDVDRQIRSTILRWLCVNPRAKNLVDPRGIDVFGAKILGPLELFAVSIPFGLAFSNCLLDSALNLRNAEIVALSLRRTKAHSIGADGVRVRNSVFLRGGFHCVGQVRVPGARIGGNLECDGGKFRTPSGLACPTVGWRSSGMALTSKVLSSSEKDLLP